MKTFARYTFVFALLVGTLSAGAAGQSDPQSTPPEGTVASGDQMIPGKFVWGDLFAAYPLQTAKFYSQIFGWSLSRDTSGKQDYWLMLNGDKPIAGVVRHSPEDAKPGALGARWVGYISVPDVEQAIEKVKANDGSVLVEPRNVPKRGTLAIVADSEGGIVGLMRSNSGDPADREAGLGDWIWVQLFSTNTLKSKHFYETVFGYEVTPDARTEREDDFFLATGEISRAGLVPLEAPEGARGGWMGFVRVADVDACVEEAVGLGSQVLVEPGTVNDDAVRIAVITDTHGGVIGLIQTEN
jgi:predicted enzyme related to lactoylglutathione lyase